MASQYGKRRAAALDDGGTEYLQRRREISQAAGRVFKDKGLQATNVNDVAREAGIDRATLYYYFGSKEEIFEEVVSAAVEANTLRIEEVQSGAQSAPEKIRTVIVSLMTSYADNYPFLYVFIQENLSQIGDKHLEWSRQMRQLNRRYEVAIVGIIRDGMSDGTLNAAGDPKIIAYGLLGMLGWTNRWFNPHESGQTAEQIGNTFADVFLGGITQVQT
ncbi:TetR/AcrR family transcriptional regulator [Cryobacterium suzukii]|uniref:TetR/AcrR family transcriptional regulator n=1 Tax=Cryobacterium suzukii TaxID=1259198 RepID=A0A4R9AHP1_9MICO|nr:TetR/AcrR family transcriptional regulator [Cryobacterium suzukii]TFD62176.1 TetR/AcrR family transcriptional regulator [Cryobacterium suzukii]